MSAFRGQILVIRGGAIGDFILTLPAITALRRQFPEACLEVLGYPHIVQLATAAGLVDNVRSIEARSLAGFFARDGALAEELANYFSDFDLIVSYLYDPDQIFRANVGRCSAAQFIQAPHRPAPGVREHASQVFLKPLEQLAIFDAEAIPKLVIQPSPSEPRAAGSEPYPVLALHPGSGAEHKNWPEASWAELLQKLVFRTRLNLFLVGGEAEGDRLQRLAAALPPLRTRVAQSLPLAELAGLLAGCNAFVGHDSGISHLAAALGLPSLLLWGVTDPEIWRPPSPRVATLSHPGGLAGLPVADVLAEILKLLAP